MSAEVDKNGVPTKRPFVRCARNLAHIAAYEDTPMQCTRHHAHQGPHTYDQKHLGRYR